MIKRLLAIAFLVTLVLACTACGGKPTVQSGDVNNMMETTAAPDDAPALLKELIGNYDYPHNPPEQLRDALMQDISENGLSMEVSEIERIEFNGIKRTQFRIAFPESADNACVVFFPNNYLMLNFGEDAFTDDMYYDEPSFVLAFKDPENAEDMVAVLTSVIKALSPDISPAEAARLAHMQDETTSTDGYSMPLDISGYQIQTRYTNPHVAYHVPDFEAKLVVKVTSLRQMWGMWSLIDPNECYELTTSEDYDLLGRQFFYEEEPPEIVYADFTVKNLWQHQSFLHGEVWQTVQVESADGEVYNLSLDRMESLIYEFGVGQRYTLFLWLPYNAKIIHAVHLSEAAGYNARGEMHTLEYHDSDWKNEELGFEVDESATIYEVTFQYHDRGASDEHYMALEGRSIGKDRWPNDPVRDEYTFAGWYDARDWDGGPFTADTPVLKDTHLYAKWKYAGAGGAWPRAHRGGIQGIDDGVSFITGDEITIIADGYNMLLEYSLDQRFRWKPVAWRLSDGTDGVFGSVPPFQATLLIKDQGEQRLYITYSEDVFDGSDWQETRRTHEVCEKIFDIKE